MVARNSKGGGPRLSLDAQTRIGARLRQMYDSVVQEDVPDRFKSLLDQLQKGQAGADPSPGEAAAAAPGSGKAAKDDESAAP